MPNFSIARGKYAPPDERIETSSSDRGGRLHAPRQHHREHLLITLNLLELARFPIDEQHPANPTNPYMSSKLMAKQLCVDYARDFVHVDDIAEAVLAALRCSHIGIEIFNLGSGSSIAVHELVSLAVCVSGREARRGEIADVVADVSKAVAVLGWAPGIPLEEGIRRMLIEDDVP